MTASMDRIRQNLFRPASKEPMEGLSPIVTSVGLQTRDWLHTTSLPDLHTYGKDLPDCFRKVGNSAGGKKRGHFDAGCQTQHEAQTF